MKLYLDKSKCSFEETTNGAAIVIETEASIILTSHGHDYLLCQSIPIDGQKYEMPQPIVLGSFEGLTL
ncbi:MAG: hypothetical protein K5651_01880 [Bacteroidales bacterium]|nr:hypothetical protein [Bacteroidales bacterium]